MWEKTKTEEIQEIMKEKAMRKEKYRKGRRGKGKKKEEKC